MPNLLQFSATPSGKGVAISASYDDGATISFSTDEQSANFMTSIVQALAAANKRVSAAENRAAAERRTADRKHKRTGDSYESGNMPTTCDAEFMRLVRAVCPKYNENTKDDDPRLVALDVLATPRRSLFSSLFPSNVRDSVKRCYRRTGAGGDYMKANNIEPKPYTTFDSIMAIGDAAKKRGEKIIMVSKFIPRSEREQRQSRQTFDNHCSKLQNINQSNKDFGKRSKRKEDARLNQRRRP